MILHAYYTRLVLWFIAALAVLAIAAVPAYTNIRTVHQYEYWVNHTHNVIYTLDGITRDLLTMQNAQRGYVIVQDTEYLRDYNLARPLIIDNMTKLGALLADNPAQVRNLEMLKEMVDTRIIHMDDVLTAQDQNGQAAAMAIVQTRNGLREMTEIRDLVAEMTSYERVLLQQRQAEMSANLNRVLRNGTIALSLCMGIMVIVFLTIYREGRRRNQIEAVLQTTLTDVRRISHENALISRMTDYLQGCRSTDESFTIIRTAVCELFPSCSGAIVLFNNSRNLLTVAHRWGTRCEIENSFTPETCWALRRGHMHAATDAGVPCCTHMTVAADDAAPLAGRICIPMLAHGETIGLFYVACENAYIADDATHVILQRISEQASLAISNLRLQERLREQSVRDPLTRLYNRRYLEETMAHELARGDAAANPLGVLVMDVDHFKRFNDTMGHDAGDALLAQFAHTISVTIPNTAFACRYGGEEFVVILPRTELKDATAVAEAIRLATQNMRASMNGKPLPPVTVSIGVAMRGQHGETAKDLISAADGALYEAKRNGRNKVEVAGKTEAAA